MPSNNRRPRGRPMATANPRTTEPSSELSSTPNTTIQESQDRPRATPSARFSRINRRRNQQENSVDGEEQGYEDAVTRFGQRTQQTPSFQEILAESPSSHPLRPGSPEASSHQHRTKRRKIESSAAAATGFTNHKYGWEGQVDAGRLHMEIVSCDGGYYAEDTDSTMYRPENVLKRDKSVYCTKRSKCDMILRHEGETPFSVEKIVIKAPDRGFTAPVQEGMIFVAMTTDDLLRRTANYTVDYVAERASSPPTPSAGSRSRERLTLLESLNDPAMNEAARRRNGDPTAPPHARRMATRERRFPTIVNEDTRIDTYPRGMPRRYNPDDTNENCDPPLENSIPALNPATAPPPAEPPFTVITDSGDDSSDAEDSSPAAINERIRRQAMWGLNGESPDDDWDVLREWRDEPRLTRGARRNSPSRVESRPLRREEMIPPNAKFFVPKAKNKVSIKFDPPL
ncbi:MAG: hypothetical protein M1820_000043 [Bogoriella megaspora]|nr:MAG: hypothetical protein M1820_000043 [Bogoriella megaspora]